VNRLQERGYELLDCQIQNSTSPGWGRVRSPSTSTCGACSTP